MVCIILILKTFFLFSKYLRQALWLEKLIKGQNQNSVFKVLAANAV